MITKFALLTGLILTNTAFATDTAAIHNHLTIAAIDQQKGLFNVRELHDMGSSGVQQNNPLCETREVYRGGIAVRLGSAAVSYTHLTLPTNREV